MEDGVKKPSKADFLRELEVSEEELDQIAAGVSGRIFPRNDGSGLYTLIILGKKDVERYDFLTQDQARQKANEVGAMQQVGYSVPLTDEMLEVLKKMNDWHRIN